MQNYRLAMANQYLRRFDEILAQMTNEMLSQEVTNSITIDFIKCMVPHHQAAIYMCENLLKYTKYEPLEKIANNIIQTQTKGIKEMKEIAQTTNYINNRYDINNYMTKYLEITKNMIEKMRNSPRSMNISLNFIGEMIPHHEGAIEMCQNLLKYRIDPRLKKVADCIIKEQGEGIRKLESVRQNLCGM